MMQLASMTQIRLRCPAAQKRPHLQNLKTSWHFNSLLLILSCIAFKCFTSVDGASPKRFVVFGSSGKTGAAIVQRLLSENVPDRQIICPVRNMAKARAVLGPESKSLSVLPCDLNVDEKEKYMSIVSGADAVIICSAYSPGGSGPPDLKGSYKVDNLAAKRIIDSCVEANVPKVVLVSSLLTNGFRAGQFLNPQYLLLNAFGGILLQKRQAEVHLQKQMPALDYTIIRPGGLKDGVASAPILFGCADTFFGGSITREQVASVAVDSCYLTEASNKIVEIVATADARQVSTQQGFESVR